MRIHRLTWLILAIAAIALLSTAGQILGFYTDWLWFREVQFTSVFVTVLQAQVLVGLAHGRRVLRHPVRQRGPGLAARPARCPHGGGRRRARAAPSRDPATVPPASGLAGERDPGPPRQLAGDGPMGAGPEGPASDAVRYPGPALRPGRRLLRVPAPALELPLRLADDGPDSLGSRRHRRVLLRQGDSDLPGRRRDLPTGPRSPLDPGRSGAAPEGGGVPTGHVRPPLLPAGGGLRRRVRRRPRPAAGPQGPGGPGGPRRPPVPGDDSSPELAPSPVERRRAGRRSRSSGAWSTPG